MAGDMASIHSRQVEAAKVEVRRLEDQIGRGLEDLRAQDAAMRKIVSSNSWRLTAPLRFISTKLLGKSAAPAYFNEDGIKNVRENLGSERISSGQWLSAGVSESDNQVEDEARKKAKKLISDLPSQFIKKSIGSSDASNGTYRLIDFSSACNSLVGADARRMLYEDDLRQCKGYYVGSKQSAPHIAFLGTTELLKELAFDAYVSTLDQESWSETVGSGDLSFALIETVWHVDNREWRYSLVTEGPGREVVKSMLRQLRERNVPVVVWFREDRENYEHFAWLAKYADLVCSVDDFVVERFRSDYSHVKAIYLPPAVQPAIYNPVRPAPLVRSSRKSRNRVMFDGWWELLEGAADNASLRELHDSLTIVESEWEFGKIRLEDCEQFKDRALGCAGTFDKAVLSKIFGAEVYLDSSIVLNWRKRLMMLRSAACGSLVAHPSLEQILPGVEVPVRVDRENMWAGLKPILNNDLQRERAAHVNFRKIISSHCLADRLQRISDELDIPATFVDEPQKVACLLVTMRPHLLPGCIERFRNDRYPQKELVVVLHGRGHDLREARKMIRPEEEIRVFQLGREHSLGACLNFAAAQTGAPYWTKVDDDDIYGANYLSDLMLYQRVVDAPVFGKPVGFVYLGSADEMHWMSAWNGQRSLQIRAEGEGTVIVAGGTIGGRREVLDKVPFSEKRRRGADSEFLRQCHHNGYPVLAADSFNFALYRSGKDGFHTWNIDDDRIRRQSGMTSRFADSSSTVFL